MATSAGIYRASYSEYFCGAGFRGCADYGVGIDDCERDGFESGVYCDDCGAGGDFWSDGGGERRGAEFGKSMAVWLSIAASVFLVAFAIYVTYSILNEKEIFIPIGSGGVLVVLAAWSVYDWRRNLPNATK